MIRRGALQALGAGALPLTRSSRLGPPSLSALSLSLALALAPALGLSANRARAAADPTAASDLWRRMALDPCIVLVRHANAPGVGDPEGFSLDRCDTQRNLDGAGRSQARALGQAFVRHSVRPAAVWASQWCRCQETAKLAFGAGVVAQPAFNSFFVEREQSAAQAEAARQLLLAWRGPGVLVVVTHQVNITALTGIFPASGEAVVLLKVGEQLQTLGRMIPAPAA